MPLRLGGQVQFTRRIATEADGAVELTRQFDAASVWVSDSQGVSYRVLGGNLGEQRTDAADDAGSFRCTHRGVLVGAGALNNRLLTLALEFTEHPDGTATGEVIAATLDPS